VFSALRYAWPALHFYATLFTSGEHFFFFFFTLEDMRGAELLNEIRVTAPFFALPLFRSPCPSSSSPFDFFFFFLRIGACVFLLLL
jgi:hypothetical protein